MRTRNESLPWARMLIGSLNLQIVEKVFLTKIEPDLLISPLVSHAMVLADERIESGSIHEGDMGPFRETQNSGISIENKIFGRRIPDFPGRSGELHRTGGREEKTGLRG